MKMIITLVALVCALPCFSQEVIEKDREVVFKSVNIVPMDRESIIENQSVVVKNGKIQSIGNPKKVRHHKKALVINAKGKYLMPGLAEMHAHVPPVDDLEPMKMCFCFSRPTVSLLYAACSAIQNILNSGR
jgi:alpha-D-ribose 1-methylphosphonate 5-triphosphate diphosphatase PhnM